MSTSRHCVSVRFTAEELANIDRLRGKIPRGTWCRRAILGKPVPVIPEPNRTAYQETARWASALSQVARSLNMSADVDMEETRALLKKFRFSLLGVVLDEGEGR